MEDNNEIPDVLRRRQDLHEKLKKLGIDQEKLREVEDLIIERCEVQEELRLYRETQFLDDAKDLLYQVSVVRQSKPERAAEWLRAFAEHVAEHINAGRSGNVAELVDEIPTINPQEER